MKKSIIFFVLLFVPFIASATIDINLYYGLKDNNKVKELQEFLISKDLLVGSATGNFYSLTLDAVKKYQASIGVTKSGYVGPLTRNAINEELGKNANKENSVIPTPEPVKNSNDIVKSLQDQIALLLHQLSLLQSQTNTQKKTETINKIQEISVPAPISQPTQIATVVLEAQVHHYGPWGIGGKESDSGLIKGVNSDSNRATIRIYEPLPYPSQDLDFNINMRDTLRILVNVNNSTNDNPPFSCEKFGNKYWAGLVTPKDHWEEKVLDYTNSSQISALLKDFNDSGSDSMKFQFGVKCTNSDGSVSQDYFYVGFSK